MASEYEAGARSRRFGQEIRHRREARGWSQQDLVDAMNELGVRWYQTTVGRIETGGRNVTWDEAVVVAVVLDLDLNGLAAQDDTDIALAHYRQLYAGIDAAWARVVESIEHAVKEYGVVPSQRDMDQLRDGTITPAELKARIARKRRT